MYGIYQIASDIDRERAHGAKRSWLLSRANKARKAAKKNSK